MTNVTIYFRAGGVLYTAVDEKEIPDSIGERMVHGGFLVCKDFRRKNNRAVVVNLQDVVSVVFEEWEEIVDEPFVPEEMK
ncbi:MAG: hypothetical protein GY868_18845 [Deltaproteobacteria bacterium]|nr:hypothetical protein [Deltaproteobacteria bacterium]